MVAVFSIFATLSLLDFKQMGIGLAVAVLIDATLIRGVLLPATMTLLGERNWWLPRSAAPAAAAAARGRGGARAQLSADSTPIRSRRPPLPAGAESFLKKSLCARARQVYARAVQRRTDALGRPLRPSLADVDLALEALDSGPLSCLTMEGEPGIGKTRMLAELTLPRAAPRGHRPARDRLGVRDLPAVRRGRRRLRRAPRDGARPDVGDSWPAELVAELAAILPGAPRRRHLRPPPPPATSAIARTARCATRSSCSPRTDRSS